MKTNPDIIILEGVWSTDIAKNSSVRSFIEALTHELGLEVSYRNYNDAKDLEHWLKIFAKTKNTSICYIAGHGVKSNNTTKLRSEIGGDINLKSILVKTFPTNKKILYGKKGILIGSCLVGNISNLQSIISSTGNSLDWIAGYGTTIPWFESTISDMLFLKYYFNGRCRYDVEYDFVDEGLSSTEKIIEKVIEDFNYIKDFKFNLVSKS